MRVVLKYLSIILAAFLITVSILVITTIDTTSYKTIKRDLVTKYKHLKHIVLRLDALAKTNTITYKATKPVPGYLSLTPTNMTISLGGIESHLVLSVESSSHLSWFAASVVSVSNNNAIKVTPSICELSSRSPNCLLRLQAINNGNASIVVSSPGYRSVLATVVVTNESAASVPPIGESLTLPMTNLNTPQASINQNNLKNSESYSNGYVDAGIKTTSATLSNDSLDGSAIRAITVKDSIVYVGTDNGNLWEYTDNWKIIASGGQTNANIIALTVDEQNNIYIAANDYATGSGRVWEYRPESKELVLVGGDVVESGSRINSMVVNGNDIYVLTSDYVAGTANIWVSRNHKKWQLITDKSYSSDSIIWSLVKANNKIYIANSNPNTHVGRVMMYDHNIWSLVGDKRLDNNSVIRSLVVVQNRVYLATSSGDIWVKNPSNKRFKLLGNLDSESGTTILAIASDNRSVYAATSAGNVWHIFDNNLESLGTIPVESKVQILSLGTNKSAIYIGTSSGKVWQYTPNYGWHKVTKVESMVNQSADGYRVIEVRNDTTNLEPKESQVQNDSVSDNVNNFKISSDNILIESDTPMWRLVKATIPDQNGVISSIEQKDGVLYVVTKNNQRNTIWVYTNSGQWHKVGSFKP